MRTALDNGDLFANAFEVAGHLQGDSATAEYDQRVRRIFEFEDFVAGQVAGFFKAGEVHTGDY